MYTLVLQGSTRENSWDYATCGEIHIISYHIIESAIACANHQSLGAPMASFSPLFYHPQAASAGNLKLVLGNFPQRDIEPFAILQDGLITYVWDYTSSRFDIYFDHKTHSQCRNIQATLRVPAGGASATCESLSRRSKTIYQPKDRRNKQETAWKYQVNDQFGATDVTITTQFFWSGSRPLLQTFGLATWIRIIWVMNQTGVYIYIQSHRLRFELCWVLQTTNTSVRALRHLEMKMTAKHPDNAPNDLVTNPFQEQNHIVQTYNQLQVCNKASTKK